MYKVVVECETKAEALHIISLLDELFEVEEYAPEDMYVDGGDGEIEEEVLYEGI